MNARAQGLFPKFNITRVDGRDAPGEKHAGCEYFALDLTHDRHALPAIAAYAESCASEYPALAADLRMILASRAMASSTFITVPAVTLPDGSMVRSFQVGQYLCGRGPTDVPIVVDSAAPWVDINYADARAACRRGRTTLITERQWLAIAHDAVGVAANWTGGAVGEGELFQGIRLGKVSAVQPGAIVPSDERERRWLTLSNGARICDMNGNAFSWVFDDVQGDAEGLVETSIKATSVSLQAPYPALKKGMGWRPDGARDWAGGALVRGGCWVSREGAGVFGLDGGWPDNAYDFVGFRCTKPIGR